MWRFGASQIQSTSKIKLNFEEKIFSKTSICKSLKNIYKAEKLRGAKWRPSATLAV